MKELRKKDKLVNQIAIPAGMGTTFLTYIEIGRRNICVEALHEILAPLVPANSPVFQFLNVFKW